ncbi:MAG TPA: aldehyde dehydrogenase [Dongiaceae bacterium]|jgi:lactaldehyde dehydrogenase/glycolaldehyde dehydrogenase
MSTLKEKFGGVDRYRHFINGQWVASSGKDFIEVENPATEEIIAQVPNGTADDAERALEAARAAQPGWEALPPVERGTLLRRLAQLILENRERLARLVVAEQGKPLAEARGEIDGAALYLTHAAEEARRITGDILPSDNADEQIWIQRAAYGVVVGLTAWNYPAALTTRKMGPALIAGNTIVIKSHEGAPLSALEIAQLAQQAGLPPGVMNVVSGLGKTVGETLVRHPITQLVSVTGSVRAGREIYKAGAEDLKVLRLELGGKAPLVVAEDADIGAAVKAAVASRFENCGQICICNERMYLHEKIADQFMERFVESVKRLKIGNPLELVDIGPKFSRPELEKVEAMVAEAVKAGATVVTGGKRPSGAEFAKGHWYEPTVLTGARNDMAIMQREVFGPVIPAMTVTDFDEGLALANDSAYGLSAYVFTKDLRRLMRLVRELKFGEIYVNRGGGDAVHAYHSGYRHSGLGGEDGKYGLEGYLRKKTIYVNFS